MSWRPTASIPNLRIRANMIATIRKFFDQRNVLEVETPLLSPSTIPDPHLQSMTTHLFKKKLFLQTSPEFSMKRLLAAGSGSIYQICKAFRSDELGRIHNPEFTMLEWYRINFDHHQLMDELDELLSSLFNTKPAIKYSYQSVFKKYCGIDPLESSVDELKSCADRMGLNVVGLENRENTDNSSEKDNWLNLLISHIIEPKLSAPKQPYFIYDFPISQAALSKQSLHDPRVAERFELYLEGVELANGFHELTDAKEQERRFKAELVSREALGLPHVPIDYDLLEALNHGLPSCAGVALGIDRLLMIVTESNQISDVMAFSANS